MIINAQSALLQPVDRDYNLNGGTREEHFEVKQDGISHALRAGQNTFVLTICNPNIWSEEFDEQSSNTDGEYPKRI